MKKSKLSTCIKALSTAAVVASISATSAAAIPDYFQSFDDMIPALDGETNTADNDELINDNWLAFGTIWDGVGTYPGGFLYQYGAFGAPNNESGAFSGVVVDDVDPNQFLNVFSDYVNGNHATQPDVVQSSVFREYTIAADDIGKEVSFTFEARRPDDVFAVGTGCTLPCTAKAFIKTIDPSNSFAQTNFVPLDMTSIAKGTWATFEITLLLDNTALSGQLLQIGFESLSSNYETTGVNYDNVSLTTTQLLPSEVVPVPAFAIATLGGLLGLAGIYSGLRKRVKG